MSADNDGKKYDVFISYRRKTGANDARLLEQALKARMFKVFFDFNSIRDGRFDERIYAAIKEAPVFILIMSSGALDPCARQEDWVRIELEYALKLGKKIISVAPSDQEWSFPEKLPGSLAQLRLEQVSKINKEADFDDSIDKIIKYRFPANLQLGERSDERTSAGKTTEDSFVLDYETLKQGSDPELVKHGLLGALIWLTVCLIPLFLISKNMPTLYTWGTNLHGWRLYPVVLIVLVWLNFLWQCLAVWGKFRKKHSRMSFSNRSFIGLVLILCAVFVLVAIKKISQEGLNFQALAGSVFVIAPICLGIFSVDVFLINVTAWESLKKRMIHMLLIDLIFVFVLGVMFIAQITGILG